jgi:hypothetical protein
MPRTTTSPPNSIRAFLEGSTKVPEIVEDPVEAELFYLQSEADNLRLELAKMQEKIAHLEAELEPLQLTRPSGTVAATWDAAGLGASAELETAILAIENWIFNQPNYESLTDKGWLTFLYEILEEPIRVACRGRRQLKIDLGYSKDVE